MITDLGCRIFLVFLIRSAWWRWRCSWIGYQNKYLLFAVLGRDVRNRNIIAIFLGIIIDTYHTQLQRCHKIDRTIIVFC